MMIKRSLLFFISTALALGAAFWLAGPELKAGQPTAAPLNAAGGSSSFLPLMMKSWPATPTPTPTATPTRTPTATVTGTPPTAIPSISFPVGSGSSDVVPRQIVRTSGDRVYIFVSQQYSTTIRAYWTTAAGLPNVPSAFNGFAIVNVGVNLISVDAVYNGGTIIHVLTNTQGGAVKDYPFDTGSNTFKAATTIVSDSHTVAGDYIGSSGVSGMVDQSGNLHIAYWSNSNHIVHRAYTYNSSTNVLTLVSGPTQVDTAGSANHPSVAVSPFDNSLTVAWVSEAASPKRILARTRASNGTWGSVETASSASVTVWTSTSAGINIDQGPSLVISSDGTKHLTYIENYDASGDYGKVHYVVNPGSGWTDTAPGMYTHDPALAINSAGDLYILGHGHAKDAIEYGGGSPCLDYRDMCFIKKTSGGAWGSPQLFAAHGAASNSFDASPSTKWGAVGWNRPETIEATFFLIVNGNYNAPTLYYARLP